MSPRPALATVFVVASIVMFAIVARGTQAVGYVFMMSSLISAISYLIDNKRVTTFWGRMTCLLAIAACLVLFALVTLA